MILPSLLLASLLSAGPEQPVTPAVADASPYNQLVQDVATDGNAALAIWDDGGTLAGVRIDRDGTLLDARPLRLSTEFASQPNVVRGDGNWLVTWIGASGDVIRRFVEDDGTMGPAVPVTSTGGADGSDTAFDGRSFLLTWSTGTSIELLRLAPDGALLDGPRSLPVRQWVASISAVGLDGGGFAVGVIQTVQTESNGTIGFESTVDVFHLDPEGNVESSAVLDRSTTVVLDTIRLAVEDGTVVAAWTDSGNERLFVAREGQAPRMVAEGAVPYSLAASGGTIYVVAVNPVDGSTLLVSEDGTERRTIAETSQSATAASFGDRLVVVMTTRAGFESDVATTVVDAALRDVAPPRRLTFAPALQERPAIARNAAGETLVTWVESGRAEGPVIMAARAGGAFVVAPVQPSGVRPLVVSDGSGFLVVWREINNAGVRAVRISREGTVLGGPVFLPVEVYEGPETCAAWSGTEYLIGRAHIIRQGRGGYRDAEILVTSISAEGAVGETRVVIPEVLAFQNLACGAGEAGTLVVATGREVLGVMVDANGVATASPVTIANTAPWAGLGVDIRPAVAANGRSFLVAWSTYDQVEWAVVNEHATVTRPGESVRLEPPAPGGLQSLAVAPRRDGYVLAWGTKDLYALALNASGHAGPVSSIAETPFDEREPALAAVPGGLLAVYTRDIGSGLLPQWRVFTRVLEETGTPRRRSARH